MYPVSTVAAFVAPCAVSPLTPGSVSVTVSSTVVGKSIPKISSPNIKIETSMFSFKKFNSYSNCASGTSICS